MVKGFVLGMVALAVIALVFAFAFIMLGGLPAGADRKPGEIEEWAAERSLQATIKREAEPIASPLALNDENLIAGIGLYGANCAVCHGTSNGKSSNIAAGLYQEPPQFAKQGVEDDPEEFLVWMIRHGIRFTGMPSFGKSLSETQIQQLSMLLKHMDALPAAASEAWKSLPSEAARPGT
jgi:mono/diheme cytochrome c family protein